MQTMKIGNTIIEIDWSYVESRTEEQKQMDDDMFVDAFYALCDEVEEAV